MKGWDGRNWIVNPPEGVMGQPSFICGAYLCAQGTSPVATCELSSGLKGVMSEGGSCMQSWNWQ